MGRTLKRGDIVWANLDPIIGREQAGHRPVVIISETIFNQKSGTVIAFALTSKAQKAPFPLTYKLPKKISGKECWVKIGQIRTLSVMRLGKTIGTLDAVELDMILEGLSEIIDGS